MTPDSILSDGTPLFISCGLGKEINLLNKSTITDSIHSIMWIIQGNGQIDTFYEWQPIVVFSEEETYSGRLILNPLHECKDSLDFQINVFPKFQADFDYDKTKCNNDSIRFKNKSNLSYSDIDFIKWNFGFEDSSYNDSPLYAFKKPGIYPTTLSIRDKWGCKANTTKDLEWYPLPSKIVFGYDIDLTNCLPATLLLVNLSEPISPFYEVNWELTSDLAGISDSAYFVLESPGSYSLKININTPDDCNIDTLVHDFIELLPDPIADFVQHSNEVMLSNPYMVFNNTSQHTSKNFWFVNNVLIDTSTNFEYLFTSEKINKVLLFVENEQGCTDSIGTTIIVIPNYTFFLPNAFTPNGDGKNDLFKAAGFFDTILKFEMTIWDKWGKQLFHTSDLNSGWNGKVNNMGNLLPAGSYVYKAVVHDFFGQEHVYKNFVVLLK